MLHGLYDSVVSPSLMMNQVSYTRGNMHKLQKMYSCMILENICTERFVNWRNSFHHWMSKHRRLIILRQDG